MTKPFYIVDVFAERPYAGNQLAVVLQSDGFSDETMLEIAAEMNYSETTFVSSTPDDDGSFGVRIFTPARQVAFAGHPLLGTAWVIRHHVMPEVSAQVTLNIPAGQVLVTFEASVDGKEAVWFTAPPISFKRACPPSVIAPALGVAADDIETTTPIQELSAGTSALLVPVRSLRALRQSQLNLNAFAPLAAQGFPPLVYVFCRETHHPENDLCARFFFEAHGVREDPASGNAAAFLGAYLLEHRVISTSERVLRIEQGYEIRRPSLVLLRVRMRGSTPEIGVGGKVMPVVQGVLV